MSNFEDARKETEDRHKRFGPTVKKMKVMEDMYKLRWDEGSTVANQLKEQNVKMTLSPRPRNAVNGIIRLLVASDPVFSVPLEIVGERTKIKSADMERFCKAMWMASGRVKGDPIHYNLVRTGAIHGRGDIAITKTEDMVRNAEASGDKFAVKEAKKLQKKTPFLFDVWNPIHGFPDHDHMGLRSYARTVKKTAGEIATQYPNGKKVLDAWKPGGWSVFEEVTLNDYWDRQFHFAWLSEKDEENLLDEDEHGLPVLPIVSQVMEGSDVFDKQEDRVEPFLEPLERTGIWRRQNLMLTTLNTNLFSILAHPMFVAKLMDPDGDLNIDYGIAGNAIRMGLQESIEPFAREVLDPAHLRLWDMLKELDDESTIYRQALGEPLGASAPFSSVALLSQTGRLPLNGIQRKASWAIGEAVDKAMIWLREEGGEHQASFETNTVMLQASDIPEDFEVLAKLDIALPQDDLQNANIAAVLAQGDKPMVSQRWIRENVLKIGDSSEMTDEIWTETSSEQMYRNFVETMIAMAQQAQAQQMMGGAPGGPGGMAAHPMQAPPEGPIDPSMMAPANGSPPSVGGGNPLREDPRMPIPGPMDQRAFNGEGGGQNANNRRR